MPRAPLAGLTISVFCSYKEPQWVVSGQVLGFYDKGATSLFAARDDQRVSYCLYVPLAYEEQGDDAFPLVVLMHGTHRNAQRYRDLFIDFAEQHRCIVIAPLFPAGIEQPGELSNYKLLKFREMRFDLLLLGIVDEVAERYRVEKERFCLFGFSGGAHFAHRFYFAHPRRLTAVSICAPGVVTLLDFDKPWWTGVSDMSEYLGTQPDLAGMRDVRVQTVVGDADLETWEITIAEASPFWRPGINDSGRTRIERICALADSLSRSGIQVRRDVVPGVAHDGFQLLEPVKCFFGEVLRHRLVAK